MADLGFIKILSVATICETADSQKVVVIHTSDKDYAIPIVKKDSSTFWYYLLKEVSERDIEFLNTVFDVIKKKYSVIPSKLNAFGVEEFPKHSHVLTKIVKPNVSGFTQTIPEDFADICQKLGYEYSPIMNKTRINKRDFSNLATDPQYAKMIEDNHNRVAALKYNFNDISDSAKSAYNGIKNGFYDVVIFTGPTGTGKTELARIIADEMKAPLYEIQIKEGTRKEDLEGQWGPSGDPNVPFVFRPGPLLKAYTDGCSLKLDEMTNGAAEVLATLNSYFDGTPYVMVEGQIYYKHPNFFCMATGNPGYEGTNILNMSLKNRMTIVDIPAITKETFTKWCQVYAETLGSAFPAEFFEKLFDLAAIIEKEGKTAKWHENFKFSIRNAKRLLESIIPEDLNLNQFTAAFHNQYTNILSMDNDNATMLGIYKQNEDLNTKIKELYGLYETTKTTVKTTKEVFSIEDLLSSSTEDFEKIAVDGKLPIDSSGINALFE